jgi:hypothetical protein
LINGEQQVNHPELRYRQIHLDFHTHEAIEGIGADFDPEEYAATLEKARVNSISTFARCHHGMIYYDTKLFPERRHPHMARNLLKEQIEACHARNIRVPIYITVQWDHFTATQHPEWVCLDGDGKVMGTPPFEAGFYREMCVNSPYVEEFLQPHTQEVLEMLPTDGIFFDIVRPQPCACKYCRADMTAEGLDPSDPAVRMRYGIESINRFKQKMTAFVRRFNADCTIFYNAGHIGPRHRAVTDAYTHWELESLPSGGWGYLHFPIAQRYARTLGPDSLGMTGKFHTSWGDFHSFKNQPALAFECFNMLALNAKCSIGDQLHPRGRIDPHVYELIGSVYSEVERKEPWCKGARPLTDVGVFTPEEYTYHHGHGDMPASIMGVTRMLEEGAQQFDIIDSQADFGKYKVLVLPDEIPVSEALGRKLDAYLAAGGGLIATFKSGMDAAKTRFAYDALGVSLVSEGPRDAQGNLVRGRTYPRGDYVEYVLPRGAIGAGLPETEHVLYLHGMDVAAAPDAEVLAWKAAPYFDRTYQHFCSHRQTPSSGAQGGPAVVRKGRAIYFANPIFSEYHGIAPRWEKRLFLNALAMLLPAPLTRHEGPSTLRITVNEQPAEDRMVVHLLHYIPERRSYYIDVIEDVIPLYDVPVEVRVDRPVKYVHCVPQHCVLPFRQNGSPYVKFVVPEINGHMMLEIGF